MAREVEVRRTFSYAIAGKDINPTLGRNKGTKFKLEERPSRGEIIFNEVCFSTTNSYHNNRGNKHAQEVELINTTNRDISLKGCQIVCVPAVGESYAICQSLPSQIKAHQLVKVLLASKLPTYSNDQIYTLPNGQSISYKYICGCVNENILKEYSGAVYPGWQPIGWTLQLIDPNGLIIDEVASSEDLLNASTFYNYKLVTDRDAFFKLSGKLTYDYSEGLGYYPATAPFVGIEDFIDIEEVHVDCNIMARVPDCGEWALVHETNMSFKNSNHKAVSGIINDNETKTTITFEVCDPNDLDNEIDFDTINWPYDKPTKTERVIDGKKHVYGNIELSGVWFMKKVDVVDEFGEKVWDEENDRVATHYEAKTYNEMKIKEKKKFLELLLTPYVFGVGTPAEALPEGFDPNECCDHDIDPETGERIPCPDGCIGTWCCEGAISFGQVTKNEKWMKPVLAKLPKNSAIEEMRLNVSSTTLLPKSFISTENAYMAFVCSNDTKHEFEIYKADGFGSSLIFRGAQPTEPGLPKKKDTIVPGVELRISSLYTVVLYPCEPGQEFIFKKVGEPYVKNVPEFSEIPFGLKTLDNSAEWLDNIMVESPLDENMEIALSNIQFADNTLPKSVALESTSNVVFVCNNDVKHKYELVLVETSTASGNSKETVIFKGSAPALLGQQRDKDLIIKDDNMIVTEYVSLSYTGIVFVCNVAEGVEKVFEIREVVEDTPIEPDPVDPVDPKDPSEGGEGGDEPSDPTDDPTDEPTDSENVYIGTINGTEVFVQTITDVMMNDNLTDDSALFIASNLQGTNSLPISITSEQDTSWCVFVLNKTNMSKYELLCTDANGTYEIDLNDDSCYTFESDNYILILYSAGEGQTYTIQLR